MASVSARARSAAAITKAELNQPTPYNTYIIDGLPPGPISNPGKAALEAVANPARSKELYFVADGTGGHVFAETLDQHLKNVARWRQIEKDAKDRLAPDVSGRAIRGSIDAGRSRRSSARSQTPARGQRARSVLARLSRSAPSGSRRTGRWLAARRQSIPAYGAAGAKVAAGDRRRPARRTFGAVAASHGVGAVRRARRARAGTSAGLAACPPQQNRRGPERRGCGAGLARRSRRQDASRTSAPS